MCVAFNFVAWNSSEAQIHYFLGSGANMSNFRIDSIETSPRFGTNINFGGMAEVNDKFSYSSMLEFVQLGAKATNGQEYSDTGFITEPTVCKFYYSELTTSVFADYYIKYLGLSIQGGLKVGFIWPTKDKDLPEVYFGNSDNLGSRIFSRDLNTAIQAQSMSFSFFAGLAVKIDFMQFCLNYSFYLPAKLKGFYSIYGNSTIYKSLLEFKVLFYLE
jgi:hypothetical protein